jgi:protein-S-isoprenylcysteine O-methyltransferase Ste14
MVGLSPSVVKRDVALESAESRNKTAQQLDSITIRGMSPYVYVIFSVGSVLWFLPFAIARRRTETPTRVSPRARWGIVLQAIAYAILWQNNFWERSPATWKVCLAVILFAIATVLVWSAVFRLGRQWRFDAALVSDHQLVTTGVYGIVRHPIYTSFFSFFVATGLLVTPLWILAIASLIFLIGTEIRVRVEDNLLASQFGPHFDDYTRKVPAYLPFLK